jgi:hypothetical protein
MKTYQEIYNYWLALTGSKELATTIANYATGAGVPCNQ